MFLYLFYSILFVFIQNDALSKEDLIKPCPDSPNCVNSVYAGQDGYLIPLNDYEDIDATWKALIEILEEDRYVTITLLEDQVIKSEFKIPVFGFIDDVVFYKDYSEEVIHFRSASRVGYYDFGVNKSRIEKIRRRLDKQFEE